MRCVESALGLGGHVVTGVVRLVARFHHADAIPRVEFFPSGFCSPIVHLWSDCSVIVIFICNQIVAHFCIVKTCQHMAHNPPYFQPPLMITLHCTVASLVTDSPTCSRWLKSRLAKQTSSDRHLSISYQHGSGARRLAAPGADS